MKLFKRTKIIYIPASLIGLLIWLIAAVFLLTVFMAVDRGSQSVSDTLYGVFPYFASTFLLIEWLASKLSNDD